MTTSDSFEAQDHALLHDVESGEVEEGHGKSVDTFDTEEEDPEEEDSFTEIMVRPMPPTLRCFLRFFEDSSNALPCFS